MVELAVAVFGRGPAFPAVGGVEDVAVGAPFEGGLGGFAGFEVVEVFKEEQPGGLLGVVELGGAAGFLPPASPMFLKACSNMGRRVRGEYTIV